MADLLGLLKKTAVGAVAGNCAVGLASLVLHPPDLVRTPLLVAASLAPTPNTVQNWPRSTGTGSLEAARGSQHVADNGVELTGEDDILGPWNASGWAASSSAGTSWVGGQWNGGGAGPGLREGQIGVRQVSR